MKVDNSLPLEYGTEENRLKIFGFWIFLGAEIALFATLFAVYFTLVNRTGNGPTGSEIFELTPVLLDLPASDKQLHDRAWHSCHENRPQKGHDDILRHYPCSRSRLPDNRDL